VKRPARGRRTSLALDFRGASPGPSPVTTSRCPSINSSAFVYLSDGVGAAICSVAFLRDAAIGPYGQRHGQSDHRGLLPPIGSALLRQLHVPGGCIESSSRRIASRKRPHSRMRMNVRGRCRKDCRSTIGRCGPPCAPRDHQRTRFGTSRCRPRRNRLDGTAWDRPTTNNVAGNDIRGAAAGACLVTGQSQESSSPAPDRLSWNSSSENETGSVSGTRRPGRAHNRGRASSRARIQEV
jgi:hypothetical protein